MLNQRSLHNIYKIGLRIMLKKLIFNKKTNGVEKK
jgi:hypothetical protein